MTRQRLTQKQENFILEYFKGGNATEAAIKAGYSKKTAFVIATENLKKPYLVERLNSLRKKAEDASIATVIERKQRLTEIIRGKISDFLIDGEPLLYASSPNAGAVEGYETTTRYPREGDPATTRKIRLHSPVQAIAELNKMEGEYAPQRTEITGKNGKPIEILAVDLTDDDLANIATRGGTGIIKKAASP